MNSRSEQPRICICILNYNNGDKTIVCLESIFGQSYKDYNIIIIDNHSTDNSRVTIEFFLDAAGISFKKVSPAGQNPLSGEKAPLVVIVESEKNGGYSNGNNLGISMAKESGTFSNLLIINNDLQLEPDFLRSMVERYNYLKDKNKTNKIALGAMEFNTRGKLVHQGFHFLNLPTGIPLPFKLYPYFRYIVGSCIFIDIDAPLMDESFFLYYDDVQYTKILERNNYIIDTCAKAHFVHEVGSTTRKNYKMYKIVYKSLKRFYSLNYPYFLVSALGFEVPINYMRCKIRFIKNIW